MKFRHAKSQSPPLSCIGACTVNSSPCSGKMSPAKTFGVFYCKNKFPLNVSVAIVLCFQSLVTELFLLESKESENKAASSLFIFLFQSRCTQLFCSLNFNTISITKHRFSKQACSKRIHASEFNVQTCLHSKGKYRDDTNEIQSALKYLGKMLENVAAWLGE